MTLCRRNNRTSILSTVLEIRPISYLQRGENGGEKSVKCEGQFFNSEMTVLHSAFPSPFDAEWEAEFDKKLELFLDVALPRSSS